MGFDQDVTEPALLGRLRRPEWVAHVLDAGDDSAADLTTNGGPSSRDRGHAVLLHLPRGERVALSDTATRIWLIIVESGASGVRMGDIVSVLAAEYGVDPTIVDHDATQLARQLIAGDWLELLPDSGD